MGLTTSERKIALSPDEESQSRARYRIVEPLINLEAGQRFSARDLRLAIGQEDDGTTLDHYPCSE
jgi:Trp operon repressor